MCQATFWGSTRPWNANAGANRCHIEVQRPDGVHSDGSCAPGNTCLYVKCLRCMGREYVK